MAPDPQALLDQAQTALQQNRLPDAKSAALEVLRLNPKLGDAEIILGLVATAATSTPEIDPNAPTDAPEVPPTLIPFTTRSETRHNFQFSAGVGWRF